MCHWKLLISPVEVTVLIFVTRWQNEHPYSPWLTLWSLKFVWMMYKCNDTTNNVHWTCTIEICFIFIQHVTYCVATVAHCWFVHRKKCSLQNMYKFLSHMTLCITLAKTNLNNADINELYLVQITGLWGTWSLFNTYCFTLKWYSLLKTLLQTVAQCS